MTTLNKCENGHYWDPSMYPSCPICDGATGGVDRLRDNAASQGWQNNPSNPYGQTVPMGDQRRDETVSLQPTQPVDEDELGGHTTPAPTLFAPDMDNGQQTETNIRPTVGWLVCTKGLFLGQSFVIYPNNNFVGRDIHSDICLSKDFQVTSNKHLKITYDIKHNQFFVTAGESKNVTYHNENPLLNSAKLESFDQLEIGQSTFVFVPFCGDRFVWNKEM